MPSSRNWGPRRELGTAVRLVMSARQGGHGDVALVRDGFQGFSNPYNWGRPKKSQVFYKLLG